MSDKFSWGKGDLEVERLVYKGVTVDIPVSEFVKMSDEEKDAYVRSKKEKENTHAHCGFEAPVYGEIVPEDRVIRHNDDGTISMVPTEEYKEVKKTLIHSFVANITFPKSLEELMGYVEEGCFDIELLEQPCVLWTVPKYARVGDVVFFMHAKTANQAISRLCTELNNQNIYNKEDAKILRSWLDKGRDLYDEYGGKIFAIGLVSEDPEEEDSPGTGITHWSTKTYAKIENM